MTTDHHAPINYGAEATSDVINSPLGELDAAIGIGVSATKPMFLAYASANIENVTGDSTEYVVIFDEVVFDQGSDYNTSTGEFTAPVTGKYIFSARVAMTDEDFDDIDDFWIRLVSTNRVCWGQGMNVLGLAIGAGSMLVQTIILDMDIDNVCYIEAMMGDGTKTVDVIGDDPDNLVTYFSGGLLA